MLRLALDTSGETSWLALADECRVRAERQSAGNATHAEALPDLVSGLLADAAASTDDIGAIVLGAGPGSFTGLRIGFAFAQGLAFARGLPVTTVSSLKAMAIGAVIAADDRQPRIFLPYLDARRNEVFAAATYFDGQIHHEILSDRIVSRSDVLGELGSALATRQIDPRIEVVLISCPTQPQLVVSSGAVIVARTIAPTRQAAGLLELARQDPAQASREGCPPDRRLTLTALSALQPNYLRAVAAKTIAERQARAPVGSIDLPS